MYYVGPLNTLKNKNKNTFIKNVSYNPFALSPRSSGLFKLANLIDYDPFFSPIYIVSYQKMPWSY